MNNLEKYAGKAAKICRNSITIKDESGKTCGVIRNAHELQSKEKSEIWGKYRAAVGLDATSCITNTRRIDGVPVYLANAKSEKERTHAEKLTAAGIKCFLYIPA